MRLILAAGMRRQRPFVAGVCTPYCYPSNAAERKPGAFLEALALPLDKELEQPRLNKVELRPRIFAALSEWRPAQ